MYYDKTSVINMRRRTGRLERAGDYWTKEEKEALATAFDGGMGITAMAMKFQRTEPAIFQQIENMDLFERKKYPSRRKSRRKASDCLCSKCDRYKTCCANREHCPQLKED